MAGCLPDTRRVRVITARRGNQGRGTREFGDQGWRTREFGDQGANNERVETWRAEKEYRVRKGITELHRTLAFPTP